MEEGGQAAVPGRTLCVVVPCLDEEPCIGPYLEAAVPVLESLPLACTVLFVDDGSTDGTLELVRQAEERSAAEGWRVRVEHVSFSRNFGKEAAILAGLERAVAFDFAALMDADLQDPPSLLPAMAEAVVSGRCDRAGARRVDRRGEPRIKSLFARAFYRMIGRLARLELVDGARDYSVMSRRFVRAVLSCQETNRFSKGIFGWVGFRTEWFEYQNVERASGETKWSFLKLAGYAVEGIAAYSAWPLQFSSVVGALCAAAALVGMAVIVVRAVLFGDPVAGWPSMVSIMLFLGGIVLLSVGILGYYLSKVYLEVKRRPLYIVAESSLDGGAEKDGPASPARAEGAKEARL